MSTPEKFLNLTEAAEFLKVSKSSLRRWSNSGYLPSYRVGVRAERRFLLTDLLDIVRKNPSAAVPQPAANPHICTNFKDRDEQWQLFEPYLTTHLAPDAAIVYVYQGDESRIMNRLAADDKAQTMMRDDRLRLISAQDSYLQDGYFDLQRMLEFWRVIIDGFQQRRIARLLLTGEMDWAALGAPGSDQLIDYEKQLDDFLKGCPNVTVVCQYDLTEFPATTIFDSVCLHATVLPAAA